MFGLDTDTIRNIKNCFAKIPQIQKVLLYGSRAKGNYKTGSDIDLILIGKNLNPDDSIYPLKEELNKLYLPYTFDISILSKLDKLEFINRILKVGKTFYQKETNELPAGWQQKKLGDVCEILDSKRKPVKKENRKKGKYPYYGATGILDYVNNYIFDEKLVLVGEDGAKWNSGDKTAFITEGKYWVNNHAHVLKPNRKKLLDEILVYSLNAKNLTSFVTGVTVPKLNQQKLRQIQIPLPPLAEQKRIVAILDKTFTAIDKIKNNTEKNLANTKELWQSYLQQSFNNPKKNWQQKKLKDCIEKVFYTKKIQKKDFLKKGKFPIISQEENYINGYWDNEIDVFRIKNQPIVIFGDHTRVIKYIDFDFILGADGVKIIKPIYKINPKFFYYFIFF